MLCEQPRRVAFDVGDLNLQDVLARRVVAELPQTEYPQDIFPACHSAEREQAG